MKKLTILLTAIILILAAVFACFGWPGFLLERFRKDGPPEKLTVKQTAVPERAVWKGSSKAFSITPIAGITVSAAENAMDKDRSFDISELSEDELEEAAAVYSRELKEDIRPLGGMHISARLKPDELLPEGYTVQVDLAARGIPEELWKDVTVFRRDDNGMYYEYASWIDGSVLTFESQQNGAIFWAVSTAVIYLSADVFLPAVGSGVEWFSRSSVIYVTETDQLNSKKIFKLKWTYSAGDEVYLNRKNKIIEKTRQSLDIARIRQRFTDEKGREPKAADELMAFKEQYAIRQLESGTDALPAEYREICNTLEMSDSVKSLYTPDMVRKIANCLRGGRAYCKSLGIKLPKTCMTVELVPKITGAPASGLSVSPLIFLSNYLVLQTQYLLDNPAQFNDLALTAAHEYFHACTNCYKCQNLANLKINEATAQTIEFDAVKWLKANGYTDAEPSLTNASKIEMYGLPLNDYKVRYADGTSKKFSGSDKSDTGYPLCHLIMYLMKKMPRATQDGSEWHNILSTYSKYMGAPSVTDFLKDCFSLSDESFTNYYYLFARTNQAKFYESASQNFGNWSYPISSVARGAFSAHIPLDNHNYTIRVRQLVPYAAEDAEGEVSMLVVCDSDFAKNLSDTKLLPVGNRHNKQARCGLFYEPMETGCGEFLNCYMMEIDGGLGTIGKKSGYSIYRLDAPPAPELKVDKNAVKFRLPKKSGAAEAGYIDGYRLSFKSEDGKLSEFLYPIGDAGKKKSLSLSDLVNKMPEGGKKASVKLSVSICEYIEGKGSEKCFGPESDTSVRGRISGEEKDQKKDGFDRDSDKNTGGKSHGKWIQYHVMTEGDSTGKDGWGNAITITLKSSPGKYERKWTCSTDYYSASGDFMYRKGDTTTVTCTNSAPPAKIKGGDTVSIAATLAGCYEKRSHGSRDYPSDFADGGSMSIVASYKAGDYAFFKFGEKGDTLYTSWDEPTASRKFECVIRNGRRDGEEMEIRVSSLGMHYHYYYRWSE
ncbi:hypothetical protein IJT93_04735 [bacterium]|nr:hypothetical protein [bacterium]